MSAHILSNFDKVRTYIFIIALTTLPDNPIQSALQPRLPRILPARNDAIQDVVQARDALVVGVELVFEDGALLKIGPGVLCTYQRVCKDGVCVCV